MVPWLLISPTFPRKPPKLLDLPTSLPPPPSPTLSWIFTSPQPPSSSSSHFIAIFSLFSSFGNLFFPPIPPSIASLFRPLSFTASFFQYITLSISSISAFVGSRLRDRVADRVRIHPRLPKNSTPTDQKLVATPLTTSFYVSRKQFLQHKINSDLHHSS